MKLVILFFSAQLAAFAVIGLREEVFGPESGLGDVLVALAIGLYVIALGAGTVELVLHLPRLMRGVARVGVLPVIGSLFGVGGDAFEDVLDEAFEFGAADESVDHSPEHGAGGRARIVTVGRARVEDEHFHESS